ncbi:MAG TPA: ABC transporter permease [Terracidiphilus sp.]|nr:ABC transporter permease [Terracidiphilus sp.]
MNRLRGLIRGFQEDARFGLRQFQRAPGFAVFTVLVLALGIGVVTAMFTICYGILLKPLPFRADRQLFDVVERSAKGSDDYAPSYAEIRQWQEATKGSAEVGFARGGVNILDTPTGAELVAAVVISPNLFSVLGVHPILGRGFSPEEEISDHPNVAVLSYGIWQRDFAGNRNVLGKTVHIDGVLHTVIGVMPKRFKFPLDWGRSEVWVPIERSSLSETSKGFYGVYFTPILRLNAGIHPEAVEAQLANVHAQYQTSGEQTQVHLVRLRDLLVRRTRPALLALEIAVLVVWLIACSNVAGLLLARVAARRMEIAVRSALGAGRKRIIAQFLTESLLLSAAGAAGGLGLATTILYIFRHALGTMLPSTIQIQLNWVVFVSLVLLTLVTALLFGTVPALLAAWTGSRAGLRSGGQRLTDSRGQNRERRVLLVGEVALSIALLIGAGLMMRTMYALRHVPLGFRTDHLLVTNLTAPGDLYKDQNVAAAAWQPLLDAVRRVPGVNKAAISTVMPFKHPLEWLTIVYKTDWTAGDVQAAVRAASPELMNVLGVRMWQGRFFNEGDTATSLSVAVVNRVFVDRFLGGGDALGKQIRFGRVQGTATIVGVIDDIHQDSVTRAIRPELYLCVSQIVRSSPLYQPIVSKYMELAVRTELPPDAMIAELRRAIVQANPHLAIGEFSTMQEAVEDSFGAQKLADEVVGAFGGLALLITVAGLFGLLSYLVEQRTQEIGIRMALGADRGSVVGMVMRQTLVLVGAGAAIGVGLALWSNRLLKGFLYGVSASDPWTMAIAPLVLVICGLLAALIPARRAASVNPVEALRAE